MGTIPSAPVIPKIVKILFNAVVKDNDTSNPFFNFLDTAIEKVELIRMYRIKRIFIISRRANCSTALVEVTGLEPAASWSQTKHSTKLSYTSKSYLIVCCCGQVCGQNRFPTGFFENLKLSKARLYAEFGGFKNPAEPESVHAPKAGALPAALHPDICRFCDSFFIIN